MTHRLSRSRYLREVIEFLLEVYPEAARVPDMWEKMLPLHYAVRAHMLSGLYIHAGVIDRSISGTDCRYSQKQHVLSCCCCIQCTKMAAVCWISMAVIRTNTVTLQRLRNSRRLLGRPNAPHTQAQASNTPQLHLNDGVFLREIGCCCCCCCCCCCQCLCLISPSAVAVNAASSEVEALKAFRKIDADGSGDLDLVEIEQLTHYFGKPLVRNRQSAPNF